ncbi:carbohydrate sulfotransferase 11-like isoform X1 [Haliotis asinina]|uniref:carbohydrate sulfotransferase 11-like isoform X1 n=1 Tax=Haliotis asinina TaxID=109174 RepID=UPI003531C195
MISRKRQVLYIMVFVSAVSFFYNSNHVVNHSPHSVAPYSLVKSLQLTLQLPRNTTSRKVIVRSYMKNLQYQLAGRVQQQYQAGDKEVYLRRRNHVKNACKKLNRTRKITPRELRLQTSVVHIPNLLYCAIPKCGTTFWRRVVVALRRKDPSIRSPFLLSYSDFNVNKAAFNRTLLKPKNLQALQHLLNNSLKFIFTRDPYQRLFSSYVDKIYAPNNQFWEVIAKKAALLIRKGIRDPNATCGQDLTFREMVRYLNSLPPQKYDEHFLPGSLKCDVCSVEYDVFGKMETFIKDMTYIFNTSDSFGRYLQFNDVTAEYKVDYIVDAVTRAFLFKNNDNKRWKSWTKCISTHAANQRIWRQLQIGGHIDKTDPYPLSPRESDVISMTEYINMALKAFKRSSKKAKAQKREAYLQAYSELTRDDLETLREKYLDDFYLYDYNDRPKDLFEQVGKEKVWDFNYYDLLNVK